MERQFPWVFQSAWEPCYRLWNIHRYPESTSLYIDWNVSHVSSLQPLWSLRKWCVCKIAITSTMFGQYLYIFSVVHDNMSHLSIIIEWQNYLHTYSIIMIQIRLIIRNRLNCRMSDFHAYLKSWHIFTESCIVMENFNLKRNPFKFHRFCLENGKGF